eukprot:523753_1
MGNKGSRSSNRRNSSRTHSVNHVQIPVVITHQHDTKFNDKISLRIPYSQPYTVNVLVTQILNKLHKKHSLLRFCVVKINTNSFIGENVNYNESKSLFQSITDYPQEHIEQKGMHIIIDTINEEHWIKVPIIIECPRDNSYNSNAEWIIPCKQNEYTVSGLIFEITRYINNKYDPFRFCIIKIKRNSFIANELTNDTYAWNNLNADITCYSKNDLKQKGLQLVIDMDVYKHNISSLESICKDMKHDNMLCPIYAKMRYQDIFTEKSLNHLYEYQHPNDTDCKYGDQCYAYKRLEKGGNDLKDRAHVIIYRHPPRGRREVISRDTEEKKTEDIDQMDEINSFCLNDEWCDNKPLYRPTDEDEKEASCNGKDGYLKLLIAEIVNNGFKSDLCLNEQDLQNNKYSIMTIVRQKLNCNRHKRMGSPLNKAEMLSIVLYTGGEVNYDLCKTQRNGDYDKWKWFDYCLFNAINKLAKRE